MNLKNRDINYEIESALVPDPTTPGKFIFNGLVGELLIQNVKKGHPPPELEFCLFKEGQGFSGKGLVRLWNGEEVVFPFNRAVESFLYLKKIQADPGLSRFEVAKIKVEIEDMEKRKSRPNPQSQ